MTAISVSKQQYPRISIITPNLNGGKTLRQTIHSIIEQDYPNLEHIIVDGGSTDNSQQIYEEYRDSISQIIVGQDRTMYDGIAKGFEAADGEIFAWLNSDDIYEPGVLQAVGDIFSRHPDWSVIYFDGTVWKQGWRIPNRPQQYIGYPELLRGHILYQDCVFFRRTAYESVGGLERDKLRLAGDYDLWVKLSAKYQFHYVSGPGSCFRIRPNQLSLSDWGKYLQEMTTVRNDSWPSLPRMFWVQAFPGILLRRMKSHLHLRAKRLNFPFSHDNETWAEVKEAQYQPLRGCRCPACGRFPTRLLFSTPDTRNGDRTIRQVYLCEPCEVAFLFPTLTLEERKHFSSQKASGKNAAIEKPRSDSYSPYTVNSLLKLLFWRFQLFAPAFSVLNLLDKDITKIEGGSDSYGRTMRSGEPRILRIDNISQPDYLKQDVDIIILNQCLMQSNEPVTFLKNLKKHLTNKGRIYLSIPNLNSSWINYYGPCWAHWNFPSNAFITSQRGMRDLAKQAGYKVKWLKTRTPREWIYISDLLGTKGLGGHISNSHSSRDQELWSLAQGASVYSRIYYDWRGKGDCLYACLLKRD